jgi:hypothetical protein
MRIGSSERRRSGFLAAEHLKTEHHIVLQALEIANAAFSRVVTIAELMQALLEKETQQLKKVYAGDLSLVIKDILGLLSSRELVFSPGVIGKQRYYGSIRKLDPATTPLPTIKSRRRRVLALVRSTVEELKRAVRIGDVLQQATKMPEYGDLAPILITRAVLSLAETKDINVVDTIRTDNKGLNLYLPSDLDPALYMPTEPLTWLEEVAHAVNDLWTEERTKASTEERRPRPISTGIVRTKLASSPRPHRNLDDPRLMVNAMQQLANTTRPLIRKVRRRGQRAVLWVPVDVTDEDIDIGDAYASDSERIGEATRRAVIRIGRPVNARDIQDEVEMDMSLRPAGSQSIAKALSDSSKTTVGNKDRTRRARIAQRIYRVGKIKGAAYYYDSEEGLDEAKNFVKFRQIEEHWISLRAEERLNSLQTCILPTVALGRAMLICREATQLYHETDILLKQKCLGKEVRAEAEETLNNIAEVMESARSLSTSFPIDRNSVPSEVSTEIPSWSAQDLLEFLRPMYPQAQEITSANKLISLLNKDIRRIPNPDYKYRFSQAPTETPEFLYDRTDAVLYAAKNWSGHEGCLQAMLASSVLEWLRDPRFVFPALKSKDYSVRLAAVACLAFLWSEEGNKKLRRLAQSDKDSGVRRSALWAYCFAGGKYAGELLRDRESNDPHPHIQEFAKVIREAMGESLWKI